MAMGNTMFFLSLLILCSKWHDSSPSLCSQYWLWNGVMVFAIAVVMLMGYVYELPSMRNAAATFLVLWVLEKQAEVKWGNAAAAVLFANFAALFGLAYYLQSRPELLLSLFDPHGMYLTRAP